MHEAPPAICRRRSITPVCCGLLREYYVYPVIGRVERVRGETAAASVVIYAIATRIFTVGQGMQRSAGHTGGGEIVPVEGVSSAGSKVRNNVSRVSRYCDGIGEANLLPSRCSFVRECGCSQQCPAARPEIANVSPRIQRSFVEADSSDESRDTGAELESKLNRASVTHIGGTGDSRRT